MSRPKFGIAREDPIFELKAVDQVSAQRLVCVGSGGCIPLSLKSMRPDLSVAAFDFSPAQIELISAKNEALSIRDQSLRRSRLNALCAGGEFEGLFRLFRQAVLEFVAPQTELDAYFNASSSVDRCELAQKWIQNRYWRAPFDMFFSDRFLNVMFGPDAIQYACPDSYADYFEKVFKSALLSDSGHQNPFLQHVFLGDCFESLKPDYWRSAHRLDVNLIDGGLMDVPNLRNADVVSLSNIFDWSDRSLIRQWTHALTALQTGALVLLRQLNNPIDLSNYFLPEFRALPSLETFAHQNAKALFYSQYRVFERV